MTDAELLDQFTAGNDEAAFRLLVERHSGLVYHTALRRTDDAELAREVCQSVFSLLARKARSLDASRGLSAWLHRAATLTASNVLRQESRRLRTMKAFEASQADPDESAAAALHPALPHLDAALERLPSRDREVLLAHFYAAQTYREIAGMRQETEAAVQRRASRALEKLSVSLRRMGVSIPAVVIGAGLSGLLRTSAPAGVLPVNFSPLEMRGALPAGVISRSVIGRAATLLLAGGMSGLLTYAAAVGRQEASSATPPPAGSLAEVRRESATAPGPLTFPAPAPAGAWQDLVARAAADLRAGPDSAATPLAAWRLAALADEDFAPALQWAADLSPEDRVREPLAAVILECWGNRDLAAAWEAYRKFGEPVLMGSRLIECGKYLFLKSWDRDPAACMVDLAAKTKTGRSAVFHAAEKIHASEPDRKRWMQEAAAVASDDARQKAVSATLSWIVADPEMRSDGFSWLISLRFQDPEQRVYAVRSLVDEIGDRQMEPWFTRWLQKLPGVEAVATRTLVESAILREDEDSRRKFSRQIEDAELRKTALESL